MRISDWSSDVCSSDLNLIEMIVEFVQGQVNEIFPHANSLIAPLALTIFAWVFLMNFMDIVPVDWLPHAAGLAGVPYLTIVPSTAINITFGIALSVRSEEPRLGNNHFSTFTYRGDPSH